MLQAFDLAFYAARFFAGASAVAPLGLDEALFLQPINIGDMVTFTARCRKRSAKPASSPLTPLSLPTHVFPMEQRGARHREHLPRLRRG